jgi:hypothetical protein
MIIADNFIMLNLPKTASSFARKVVYKACENYNSQLLVRYRLSPSKDVKEFMMPNIKAGFRSNEVDQHGTYCQIPENELHGGREVFSIVRNPFDAFISRYNYGDWIKNIPESEEEIKKIFTDFPELTFLDYLKYSLYYLNRRIKGVKMKNGVKVGSLTVQFIQMYSINPEKLLAILDKDFFDQEDNLKNFFPDITFLHTENINQELYDFLIKKGFRKKDLQFVLNEPKKNVSTKRSTSDLLIPEAVSMILECEWFLFKLFPEYLTSYENV